MKRTACKWKIQFFGFGMPVAWSFCILISGCEINAVVLLRLCHLIGAFISVRTR